MIAKDLNKVIESKFICTRPKNPNMTGETTLLCYATMDLCKGNAFDRQCGKRTITSLFRRNGINSKQTRTFIDSVTKMKLSNVARYLMRLKPYTEMKRKLLIES